MPEKKTPPARNNFDKKNMEKRNYDRKRPDTRGRSFGKPAPPRRPRENPGLVSRKVALDTLVDVFKNGAFAQLALHDRIKSARLDTKDAAFATNICMGSIQYRLRLQYQIGNYLQSPLQDPVAMEILGMGAYQILYMDRVPDSAAVNTSVELAGKYCMDKKGLINAVLRRITENKPLHLPEDMPENEKLSIAHSMPLWIVDRLRAQYDAEQVLAILSAKEADFTVIRPNTLRMRETDFPAYAKKQGWRMEEGLVPGSYRLYDMKNPANTDGFRQGLFSIEGEAAQLAARITQARPGLQVYDACAAPGGKSMLMAEMMQNTGRVYSMDVHEHRIALIKGYTGRLGLENVRPIARDATVLREDSMSTMDIVLVDAPCSGMGVYHNKQDIKYRLKEEDIDSLAVLQKSILDTCCQYVKKGGLLVYATCTLFQEENQQQVEAFLQEHPNFAKDAIPDSCIQNLPKDIFLGDAEIAILPGQHDLEGFYIARMRRMS